MRRHSIPAPALGLALLALLALPPVVGWLQARMPLQMLVQIPLLVAAGYLLRTAVPPRWRQAIAAWNPAGINGILLATFVLAFWMLPRSMDAAVSSPLWSVAKILTLPLLVGLPLGLSWRRTNFIVRGVVCTELIAMALRLGFLYLDSPVQLCNNYLINDQQLTGHVLLWAGGALFLWIALQVFAGHLRVAPAEPDLAPRADAVASASRRG